MGTDGLVSSSDLLRALGISRQRLGQVRDQEGFPSPAGEAGPAYLWRWADVERWLESRRGWRPEVNAVLEHRLRQLERIGYRVWVGPEPDHAGHRPGDFPTPGERWLASISMRGWGSEGSRRTHDTAEGALVDALDAFYDRMDRADGHGDRDLKTRLWELVRLGWRPTHDGGTQLSTTALHHVYELVPPGGGPPIAGRAENLHEAKRQAIEQAEEAHFGFGFQPVAETRG